MTDQSIILIVDDEKHTRDGLRMSLEDEFEVYVAGDHEGAINFLKEERVDVMVTDLRLGGDDGMALIDDALALPHPPICIMMTAYGSVDTAVEAMKRGAYHFVTKPLNIDELEIVIRRALRSKTVEEENVQLRQRVDRGSSVANIIGKSAAIVPVLETIQQVAPSSATVLIEGESGTGKELVAGAIHNLSGRPPEKLVVVHCAALSPQLLESELFGHEKGSFTGATEKRIGRFELAHGGTLFLDEIGEIEPETQVKLLRAIGEQTIERVGGSTPIKVDVRVLAATNKDLRALVAEGRFREDLYFRIKVVNIHVPALRERPEDIVLLAGHFCLTLAEKNGKEFKELSTDALAALRNYPWPGNVRELRTAIEHGVVMSNASKIHLRHLPPELRGEAGAPLSLLPSADGTAPPPETEGESDLDLDAMERRYIYRALDRTGGNRTDAADLLGISRRTLQRKLKEMGVTKSSES